MVEITENSRVEITDRGKQVTDNRQEDSYTDSKPRQFSWSP